MMEDIVAKQCSYMHPDVLLVGGAHVSPSAMIRLRERYDVLIGFVLGYNHLLAGFTPGAIQAADFVVCHDSYMLPAICGTRDGKCPNVFFLPSMAEPEEHHSLVLSTEDHHDYGAEIGFIGGVSANRIATLQRLTHRTMKIWGPPAWSKVKTLSAFYRSEPVYGLKKSKIYNACKIILNVEDDEKQINAFSQRIPETLACGGFVLSEWRRDLELTPLIDGESVAIYRSLDELVEKVDFYLSHPEDMQRITTNGRNVVVDSMTYEHGATNLLTQIESILHEKRLNSWMQIEKTQHLNKLF